MDKNTKIMIGVGVAALAAYYIYQKYYATSSVVVSSATSSTGTTAVASASAAAPAATILSNGLELQPPLPAGTSLSTQAMGWLASTGPTWVANWNNVYDSLPSAVLGTFLNNLNAIVPYWAAGTTPPSTLANGVQSFISAYGFPQSAAA